MNRIFRNATLLCLGALASVSQASLTDDFSLDQAGATLTSTGSETSTGLSLGNGLNRFLINTQSANSLPGVLSSSVSISGGAFNFNNDPLVQSDFAIDYRYTAAVDFTGTTGFQVDFRTNDLPYEVRVVLRDASGQESLFRGNVGTVLSPSSVFADGVSGSADLSNIVLVSLRSDRPLAGTDSSIVRFASVSSAPAVPGPAAMIPFGLSAVGYLRRRRRA